MTVTGENYTLHLGDCIAFAREYAERIARGEAEPFHALFCDPPYHLTSITKRFGGENSAPAKEGVYARSGSGFMGKQWDGGDIAFRPETWATLASVLHPGAFIFAFAGTRGYHRMAVAMEDAGLVFHPSFFLWGFAQGFPKATNISKQIDKAAGEERKVVGCNPNYRETVGNWRENEGRPNTQKKASKDLTAPATPLAAAWKGHRYGLQAIKPAAEVIVMARKPYTNEQIYAKITETFVILECISCLFCSALDAVRVTNQIHLTLRQVVEDFALADAGCLESLGSVSFVGESLESSPQRLTLRDFVLGNALTVVDALRLVNSIKTGEAGDLSTGDMSTSSETANILPSIAQLWRITWAGLCLQKSMSTIATGTSLITELKTLNSYLWQTTLEYTTKGEHIGGLSIAKIAENALRKATGKLLLQDFTFAQEIATENSSLEGAANRGISPILVAQVPYHGKPIDRITGTGAGALNVDSGRIGSENITSNRWDDDAHPFGGGAGNTYTPHTSSGRWPANLLLSHHPDCVCVGVKKVKAITGGTKPIQQKPGSIYGGGNGMTPHEIKNYADADGLETVEDWRCVEGCAVRELGEQSGESKGLFSGPSARDRRGFMHKDGVQAATGSSNAPDNYGDSGTASRFFFNSDFMLERLEYTSPLFYQAKAGRAERDAGLGGMPIKQATGGGGGVGNYLKDINSASGKYGSEKAPARNSHPCAKPLKLCQHLATLLLPPAMYSPRRLFVPFAGSASEMIGAILAGWDVVRGVEMEHEYHAVGNARLAAWASVDTADIDEALKALRVCEVEEAEVEDDNGESEKQPRLF